MQKIIHTVGNMVDIPTEKDISRHRSKDHIVFVGKMSYEPNIVAVIYFVNKIFTKLVEVYPALKFTIVGANPDERVKRLGGTHGVIITGFVDSIIPYFQDATIVVAPMLTGAGIQNKIIQAMSYGCCVATTSTGAEGLTVSNNEIAIYNTEDEWIFGITDLLAYAEKRQMMGMRARAYVVKNLSKDVISKQFWQFIELNNKCQKMT